jgi:hypothetical protein
LLALGGVHEDQIRKWEHKAEEARAQRGETAAHSEIRISKSETNPNEKNSKLETTGRPGLENL